ncbi:SBBP repeat-containing protein [Kordiimonas gwangyangensis]|uniref:SBBP repeat-containing protein n=1 Tax=Kordiimonas gwangyangensis TaxID=288022 RepID=UPI0003749187|nr:SBBP repeat-containing protein [Kordiimonas gwangyangensis]
MAFFGTSSGGLFGLGGQQTSSYQIVGVDYSLISASFDAKLTQRSIASLSAQDRAAYNFGSTTDGVTPPWQQVEETKTLNQQIREVRELTKFIDLKAADLKSVSDNADKQATFALFKALSNLRILAEYASSDSTSSSSLSRLNDQFQSGLSEVRDYLSTADLEKLELFLGDKQYKTETSTRLGKNGTSYDASLVTDDPNAALNGITGNEVFTVSITKSGATDDITIDLSEMSGTLSLNNIKDFVNSKIEAVTALDDEGEEYIKNQTRFDVRRDGSTGRYSLQIDGTITEEVKLSAATSAPTLYVASAVKQLDDDYAITSRISEFNGLDGTITLDDTTSFAAIDYEATAIKGLVKEEEDDDVDPKIKEMRDKMLADALASVTKDDEDTDEAEDTDNASSLTNIDSANKVNADTSAKRVAVDSEGGIYVVGTSSGSFGHQLNTASGEDVFLTKFDSEGNVVFSRLLGTSGTSNVSGITVDADDNVILVGQTDSALSSGDVVNSTDLFVQKISKRGDEVFRYQLDTFGETGASGVAVNSAGEIFVGGYTKSGISATSGFSGGQDALILKLSASGQLTDSTVFGTSDNEAIKGLAVDASGNLVVASEENGSAVVRRIDGSDLSNQTASVNFGSLGSGGAIQGITIDNDNGKVYIAGTTTNGSLNAGGSASTVGTTAGGYDGFVSGLTLSGSSLSADFTSYLATSDTDRIADVTVSDGKVYVAGSTGGTFSGEQSRGSTDGFVARIDGSAGTVEDIEQFGEGLAGTNVGGVAFTSKGDSVLSKLGLPQGSVQIDETRDIQTQTSAKVDDFFYISVGGGVKKRIELDEGDTFKDLARKLRIAGFGKLDVEVSSTAEGEKLKISALDDGVPIEFFSGKEGRDLLQRIGLEPGRILPKNEVFDIKTDADKDIPPEEDVGGVFALGIDGAIHLNDKQTAKYVLGLLDSAISTVQRAYRSLTYNPLIEELKNANANKGSASPYQAAQLANLQTGLARLQSGASSSSLSIFA